MLPPLVVYVHLPWCVRKCPYCDFNSHAAPRALPEDAYVEALLEDLRADLDFAAGRRAESVFIGGGTPSLFRPEAIARLLAGIRAELPLAPGAEITLEANPGTIERGRFEGYAEAGVNRVSLGAQSFAARQLEALGRIHSPADTASAVAELRRAGIANLNLDLMYALPGQDLAGALEDVERALALEPDHLSHYQLTLEPGTPFHRRPPPLPDDDLALDMQLACQARIAAAGLAQYEISAYARPGRRCRHNLAYWRFEDYLGLGAGAHGKATTSGGVVRTERPRSPREYLAQRRAAAAGTRRAVSAAELPFEFMLNALRLVEGFSLADFEQGTGLPAATVLPVLETLERRGLIERAGDRLKPSPLGFRFLNDLQSAFLPEPGAGRFRVA